MRFLHTILKKGEKTAAAPCAGALAPAPTGRGFAPAGGLPQLRLKGAAGAQGAAAVWTPKDRKGQITLDKLGKTIKTSLAVISCAASLPLFVWGSNAFRPQLAAFTSTVGKAAAFLSFPKTTSRQTVTKTEKPQTLEDLTAAPHEKLPETQPADPPQTDEQQTEIPQIELPSPDPSEIAALPYPEQLEDRDGAIETVHYGKYSDEHYFDLKNGGQVRNCTNIPDKELFELSEQLPDIHTDPSGGQPQVLIYHTHTTESFEPYTRDFYDASFSGKTTDPDMNMVAVGDELCSQLEKEGIAVLHDTLIHDYPSYNDAYPDSRASVEAILEKYPSIQVVLDIHRDGIQRQDGTRVSAVAEINGSQAAQMMIISCCDDGSGEIPFYEENFKFACMLQSQLETDWQGLTRPVLFDCRHYNQDLSKGSLLIEIGSHGNSIDQAKYSARLLGSSLAKIIKELEN